MRVFAFIGPFDLFTITEKLLWSIAIVATILLLILTAMSFFDEEEVKAPASKKSGALFDARTILLFFTFFGWTAVLAHLWEPSLVKVILYGLPVGALAALAPALFSRLQLPRKELPVQYGFNLQEALSSTGEVLSVIPPHNGKGTVHLNLRSAPYRLNAVSRNGELPAGLPVRVVALLDEHTLIVEPLDGHPPNLPNG